MKAHSCFALVLAIGSVLSFAARSHAAGDDVEKRVRQSLGLGGELPIGDPAFNREVRKRIQESKTREQFMRELMKQSDLRDVGVNFYYYKNHLFVSWVGSDEKNVVKIEIQIAYDEAERPANVSSALKRSRKLPLGKEEPAGIQELVPPPP